MLSDLVEDATRCWQEFERRRPGYHTYVHADWRGAVAPLRALARTDGTFLELGSGLGVITILADLLGLDAYGIELDPWLHGQSLALAERHGSRAMLAHGSFVPEAARHHMAHTDTDFLTVREGEPAFREIGMQLADFDVIYAFPWPGEEDRYLELARHHARRDAKLVLYSSVEGYACFQRGRALAWSEIG